MTDRELKTIEYNLHMALLWISSLKDAGTSYKDDFRRNIAARKYVEKARNKLKVRRERIAASQESNRQYLEDMADYDRNRF